MMRRAATADGYNTPSCHACMKRNSTDGSMDRNSLLTVGVLLLACDLSAAHGTALGAETDGLTCTRGGAQSRLLPSVRFRPRSRSTR